MKCVLRPRRLTFEKSIQGYSAVFKRVLTSNRLRGINHHLAWFQRLGDMVKLVSRTISAIWLRIRQRWGHKPGPNDVSTLNAGEQFWAKPNYYYFRQEIRPCYMPVYHQPKLPIMPTESGRAITDGWPCEAYRWHNQKAGPNCWSAKGRARGGDWIQVIGQITGENIRDEHGYTSETWDVVLVPFDKVTMWADLHNCEIVVQDRAYFYIGFTPDLWMGNTGWHGIPWHGRAGEDKL